MAGFSLIGGTLASFILLWWITDVTANAAALAIVNMFGLAPQVLLGPFSARWPVDTAAVGS